MSTRSHPRWSLATDLVLGATVVAWVLLLGVAHPSPTLRIVVPLIVVVVVVHRVLVLVEQAHRRPADVVSTPVAAARHADDAANAA